MKIIKATIEDLDILTPLFDGYMVFYKQKSNPQEYGIFLGDRMQKGEAEIFIALNEEGEGMGFTLLYPTFSSVSQARIFTLNDLFVHPDHRKKGVASELMNAAGNFAKLLGAVRLQLETENTNVNAQALYKKEGWQKETNFFYHKKL